MQTKTDKVISDSLLSKLNMHIDSTLKEKRESGIDFDFLEKVYGRVLRSKNYVAEGKVKCVVPIKEAEILKLALLFLESIDSDFYQKAKDVILGLDERTTMNMVSVTSNQKEGREGYVRTSMGKSRLYVPTHVELPNNKILGKEMCTLEDLYTLVHEISHLFDLNYEDSLPSRDEIEGKETKKRKNRTRELFSESTAISFETLLTEYLMNNTDYPKDAIKQIYNRRVNDLYDMTSSLYCKLLLAKEKERHGAITCLVKMKR